MHAHWAVILNQRRWQSLGGQHGKGVDGLLEKVSFQMTFEGVKSRWKSDVSPWYEVGTLATDGRDVTFRTRRRELDRAAAHPGPSSLYQM